MRAIRRALRGEPVDPEARLAPRRPGFMLCGVPEEYSLKRVKEGGGGEACRAGGRVRRSAGERSG